MPYTNINNVIFAVGRTTPQGVNLLGTAFMLPSQGKFATAAHVTNKDDNDLVLVFKEHKNFAEYQDTSDTQVKILPVKISALDPFSDLCVLSSDSTATSNFQITGSDNVRPGDAVNIFGYPHSDHGRMVLTMQKTEVGARILLETEGIKTKQVVLNIQSRPGQSGSPIFSNRDHTLIGILLGSYAPQNTGGVIIGGIDPQTLHQTTHCMSAEYLLKMI